MGEGGSLQKGVPMPKSVLGYRSYFLKESNRTCMALDLSIYRGQNMYGLVVIDRGT